MSLHKRGKSFPIVFGLVIISVLVFLFVQVGPTFPSIFGPVYVGTVLILTALAILGSFIAATMK